MEFFSAVGTGVISGVVSAALILFARIIVLRHLLPWYQAQAYRGITIDGVWHASAFEMAQDITLELRQHAGSIVGDARFYNRDNNAKSRYEEIREFSVSGRIQDRYITLTLSHKNRQRIGVVSFLLEPVCDGRQLEGWMSFVSMHANGIDGIDGIEILFAHDKGIVIERREQTEAFAENARKERRKSLVPSRSPELIPTPTVGPIASDSAQLPDHENDGKKNQPLLDRMP